MLKFGKNISEIAAVLGRNKSTISREIKRNRNQQGEYNSWGAYSKAVARRRVSIRKLRIQVGSELYFFIVEHLEKYWSPEMIARCWNAEHPDARIAFATIYRAVRRGIFKGIKPKTHLRRRGKKKYAQRNKFNTIQPEHTIHERPEIIEKRERFGDWEGDTVCGGRGKGGLLTLVDRKSRFLIARLIPNFNSETIRIAMVEALEKYHPQSITLDNGAEFAKFREFEQQLNTTVFFADPHSPWQRGTNESTNDQLRFWFPKGFDFRTVSQSDVDRVVALINARPRICLGDKSPHDVFCCT
jgi:IS30 family transposase